MRYALWVKMRDTAGTPKGTVVQVRKEQYAAFAGVKERESYLIVPIELSDTELANLQKLLLDKRTRPKWDFKMQVIARSD